ncbi:MAG: hypothetical protein WAL25_16325, partial [Acidimicrobiia bacterium]
MTTSKTADAPRSGQSTLGHLSIPSKLTLTVVPLAVISILAALLSVWSGDDANTVALVIAVVVALSSVGTLFAAFLLGRSMSRGISEVTRAN